MAKEIIMGGVPTIGYKSSQELKGTELPYPKDWDGKYKPEQMGPMIQGYQGTKFSNFLQNFHENLEEIVKRNAEEKDIEVVGKKLDEDIKKLVEWMFTEYPQFVKYRLNIAGMLIGSSQLLLYYLACDDLIIIDNANKNFSVNPVTLCKLFMGEYKDLPIDEFHNKLNFVV